MESKDVIVVPSHVRLVLLKDVRVGDLVVCGDGSALDVGDTRVYGPYAEYPDRKTEYSFRTMRMTPPHGQEEWYGDESTQVLIVKG